MTCYKLLMRLIILRCDSFVSRIYFATSFSLNMKCQKVGAVFKLGVYIGLKKGVYKRRKDVLND